MKELTERQIFIKQKMAQGKTAQQSVYLWDTRNKVKKRKEDTPKREPVKKKPAKPLRNNIQVPDWL